MFFAGTYMKQAMASKESGDELRLTLLLLRLLLLVLSLLAFILMLVDAQTSTYPLQVLGLPSPVDITATARYKLFHGLKYYVIAMGILAGYSFIQILLSLVSFSSMFSDRSRSKNWCSFIGDMAMAYLSVSATSVAVEIAYIAQRGEPSVMWNKLCGAFGHFCLVYGVSMVSALLSSLTAFAVAAVSAFHLFRAH